MYIQITPPENGCVFFVKERTTSDEESLTKTGCTTTGAFGGLEAKIKKSSKVQKKTEKVKSENIILNIIYTKSKYVFFT